MDRGRAWVALKEHHRAIEDFTRAIEFGPGFQEFEAFMDRADALREIQEYDRALDDYDKAISVNPDSNAFTARGRTYLDLKEYDSAIDDFDKATSLDMTNPRPHVHSSYAHRALGNDKKAIDALTRAINLLPEVIDSHKATFEEMGSDVGLRRYEDIMEAVGELHCDRAYCYLHLGDNGKAIEDFDAAIELMPENADFYCARASAHVHMDDHGKAMGDLETATALDSSSTNVLFVRAVSHFNRGELYRAREDSAQAIRLSPYRGDLYCVRGRSHLHLGDHASAIVDLDRAIELEPQDDAVFQLDGPLAYVCRGLAHTLLGDNTTAKRDYRKALESGYSQADIEAELAELTQDCKSRQSAMAFVPNVMFARRSGVTRQSQAPRSVGPTSVRPKSTYRGAPRPSLAKQSTMSKEEYTDLFGGLGFHDIEIGKTLKHRKLIPSLYFNCRYDFVSFVGYEKDRYRYDSGLWNRIPPEKEKDDKPRLVTVVPTAGREQEAFEEILRT